MKRNNERQIMPYYPPILDDYMVAPKRRRWTEPEFDEVYMVDGCYDPCDPCNSCVQCCCEPCGVGCGSGSIGLDEKPTEKDCIWQVCLDVSCYNPEDIVVYTENNKLFVEAVKEPLLGPLSLLSVFKKEYEIPKEYDLDNVGVYFSSDCILVITIPCVRLREYPVQPIGPARCFVSCNTCPGGSCEWKPTDNKKTGKPDDKSNGKSDGTNKEIDDLEELKRKIEELQRKVREREKAKGK